MTENILILESLIEECAEVIQRVTKAIRFGMKEIQPGQLNTNSFRIVEEYNDLLAVMEMVVERGIISEDDAAFIGSPSMMSGKKEKVLKYIEFSRSLGIIDQKVIDVVEVQRFRDGATIEYKDSKDVSYYLWSPTGKIYNTVDHRQEPVREITGIRLNILFKPF